MDDRKDKFISKAKNKYDNLYDYDNIEYVDYTTPILIKCNRCGNRFKQSPRKHIDGRGCTPCNNKNRIKNLHNRDDAERFVEKALKRHKGLFSYEKVKYLNSLTKVEIFCKSCEKYFKQLPSNHLSGKGCVYCRNKLIGNRSKYSYDKFISKLSYDHLLLYSFNEEDFNQKNNNEYQKIKILCKKCKLHFLQSISTHLSGHGCPNCNSKRGIKETCLYNDLKKHFDLDIIKQYRPKFLQRQSIDLFIPKLNLGIEYQGIQHFSPVERFGGELEYLKIIERDFRKKKICDENDLELIYFTYKKNHVPNRYQFNVITDIKDLIKFIKNKIHTQ